MRRPKRFLFFTLAVLPILLATTDDLRYVSTMAGFLYQLAYILIVVVAPILLLYGFLKSAVDAIRCVRPSVRVFALPLLGLATASTRDAVSMLQGVATLFLSLFTVMMPFVIILIWWKGFTKLVKA